MNTATTAAALELIARSEKGLNAGHLARELGLSCGDADTLAAELLASGAVRRLPNGRLGAVAGAR